MMSLLMVAAAILANYPVSTRPDTELSATQRVTSVTNRSTGKRRLGFVERLRKAAASRLRAFAAKRKAKRNK